MENEFAESQKNPDFVALGLGGTGMMGMLWTVAMGKIAVGVEMRGDPHLGVHWNIREDLYHQLGLIDQMMIERYGISGVPKRENGSIFRIADLFYSPSTQAGDIVADEIISGYTPGEHIAGIIRDIEFIDDRWIDGQPHRKVIRLDAPTPPTSADPRKIRSNMEEVLDGPSTFQASAASLLTLLRRYLEAIEQMDKEQGRVPRVRLFTHHRVLTGGEGGFVSDSAGRKHIRIEALQELDMRGKFVRVRAPGTSIIDLGVPELFVIAQGFKSDDAAVLGFQQEDVAVDHGDGRGAVVAQADYVAGLVEILVDGRLRRRISSEFDDSGVEYWTRQIAVGHENDPEVGWILVQVPDFMSFDPVDAKLVAAGTDPESAEFFAAYQKLLHDFFINEAALVLDLPVEEVRKAQMVYGPKLFTLVERMGRDPRVAANGIVAGDSFGNGHFMTSGGAMTGMIGHAARILDYWKKRSAGCTAEVAIKSLAIGIAADTTAWLKVSQKEFKSSQPVNFGKERSEAIDDIRYRGEITAAGARRKRHGLMPLDSSDWRRPVLRPGKVLSYPLPSIDPTHPQIRQTQHARTYFTRASNSA